MTTTHRVMRRLAPLIVRNSIRQITPHNVVSGRFSSRLTDNHRTLLAYTRRTFETNATSQNQNPPAQEAANNTATSSEPAAADSTSASAQPSVPDLSSALAEAEKKLKDVNDKWLRAEAEMQNVRRRAQLDVDNTKKFAIQSFAKQLLEVADTMELAVKAAQAATAKSDDPLIKSLHEGIAMTDMILQKVLSGANIKRIEALGKPFDPNLHDGLYQIDDPNLPAGTVAQVLKSGYTLNDRILRAANVGTVRQRTQQQTPQHTTTDSNTQQTA